VDWLLSEMSGSWIFWVVSAGLAAIGTAGTAATGWHGHRASDAADGIVVGLVERTDGDGAILYSAEVVFAAGGAERRMTDPIAYRPAAHHVGKRVRVWYPPGCPDQAQIGQWRYVGPFLWAAVAGWGCLVPMLVWRLG
jgi:hypothetical protein